MKMIIFLIPVWITISQLASAENIKQTPLCCPIGWTLAKLKVSLFQSNKYACLNAEQEENMKNDVEILGKTLPLGGYQIQHPSNATNIPICNQLELHIYPTVTKFKISSNSCLARFDRRIAGLSCPADRNEKFKEFSFMHKCCPINYFYDSKLQKCVIQNPSLITYRAYDNLFKNIDDGVVFVDRPMNCPKTKVLVEYRLKSRDFYFHENKLMLAKVDRENFFDIQNYCVEAIVDGENKIDELNHTTESHVRQGGIFVEKRPNVESINVSGLRSSQEYFLRTCTHTDICSRIACIRRCCSDGETYTKGSATSYCKKDEFDIAFHNFHSLDISGNFTKPEVFGILRSLDCLKYRLDPESFADESHTINSIDGSLYVMQTKKNYTNNQYCVEKVPNSNEPDKQKLYTFLCFDSKVVGNDKIRFKMYPVGLLISCLFYALTLCVYLCISRLRNLPGKILICLVCSLFSAYLSIALGQLMPTSNDDICFASGFFVYFCLMAAFAWMNVMCFDIWQTFGSTRKKHGIQSDQNKRFLIYSAYGWGLPTTLTIITVSLTKANVLSENLRPNFGHGRCWFTYDTVGSANLLFFSGPVGILFLINLVFFTLTLRYCNRVKREIFRMQSSNMDKPILNRRFVIDKARFAMNTKLFVVMGITWLLELLSIIFYDHAKTFFWAISDSFNVLLGVFVFFIFAFKKRIWNTALERIGFRVNENTRTLQNATLATPSAYAKSNSMTRLNAIDGNASLFRSGGVKQSSPL